MTTNDTKLADAYRSCEALARGHYENFPVASLLLPRRIRRPVAVIYAFARTADDLADEGNLTSEQRLVQLDAFRDGLAATLDGSPSPQSLFLALADVQRNFRLPAELFFDLISAFRQDVGTHRYQTFTEVADYCRRSANPVGRLLLHLNNDDTPVNLRQSDAICTSLQLINFLQDVTQDLVENDRIYVPQEEMERFEVSEEDLRRQSRAANVTALFEFQRLRARQLMCEGAPLAGRLGGRFGVEIRLIVAGGFAVLDNLDAAEDPYLRPRLRRSDWLRIVVRALLPGNLTRCGVPMASAE